MNEKQQHIIESGLKIFGKKGYGATTTAEVANDANVSVGTLFNYYPTKQDLVNQLYLFANRHYCEYAKNLKEKKRFQKRNDRIMVQMY